MTDIERAQARIAERWSAELERRIHRLEAIAGVMLEDGLRGVQALELADFDGNTDAFLKGFHARIQTDDEWEFSEGYLEVAGNVLGAVGFQDCQHIMQCLFPWEKEPRFLMLARPWPNNLKGEDDE